MPLAGSALFGAKRVDDCAESDVGRAAALRRRNGDKWRDGDPLRTGQIGRIICWIESTLKVRHERLLPIRKPCSLL